MLHLTVKEIPQTEDGKKQDADSYFQNVHQLRELAEKDFVLWLGHRNYWVSRYPDLPVDLILSGHAHGGIVRLPGLGGVMNNDHSLGAEYEAGIYPGEGFQMVVSRGLGNSVPVPRLFNRPEIVSIVLKKKQA